MNLLFSNKWQLTELLVALIAILFMIPSLGYFDGISWFGLLILPFILRTKKEQKGSTRYFIIATSFGLCYFLVGEPYWLFASGLALLYSIIENRIGKLNNLAFYALIFYLPLTRSFFTLFGFYIRLQLTKWAGLVMSFFDSTIEVNDTVILFQGDYFSVDSGCMGLRLVITGFLLTLLIINQHAIKSNKAVPQPLVGALLSFSFLLIIVANFIRIVLIIAVKAPAESFAHEAIGIGTFVLFHIIPSLIVIPKILARINSHSSDSNTTFHSNKTVVAQVALALCLIFIYKLDLANSGDFIFKTAFEQSIPGYQIETGDDGIKTFYNDYGKVIVKPVSPFSFSNHHPLICWRGDGYGISQESTCQIGDLACSKAILISPEDEEFDTSWWYMSENGQDANDEISWRSQAIFKAQKFYLVNITSKDQSSMIYLINDFKSKVGRF